LKAIHFIVIVIMLFYIKIFKMNKQKITIRIIFKLQIMNIV
jgi:hypothetical protein